MLRLPVSGLEITLRVPNGEDDLAILEMRGRTMDTALTILGRLASLPDQTSPVERSWLDLTVTDFEFALLVLRAYLFGDAVTGVFSCSAQGCGERMELSFSISELTSTVTPGEPRDVTPVAGKPGWFRLANTDAIFRLPIAADQQAVLAKPAAEAALEARCVDPPKGNARRRARIERAMSALAPEVSRFILGQCVYCAATLEIPLYVPQFVAEEMRRSASGVYDDIHAIAHAYHWPESKILAMPRVRRQSYADRIRTQSREVN
jgi:hypothetical protein